MFTYTDNDQLKKELKKCIIDNGYTAKMICDKQGMLPQTYQTLINKKNFSFADMKRILDCMDVELRIDFVPVARNEKQCGIEYYVMRCFDYVIELQWYDMRCMCGCYVIILLYHVIGYYCNYCHLYDVMSGKYIHYFSAYYNHACMFTSGKFMHQFEV